MRAIVITMLTVWSVFFGLLHADVIVLDDQLWHCGGSVNMPFPKKVSRSVFSPWQMVDFYLSKKGERARVADSPERAFQYLQMRRVRVMIFNNSTHLSKEMLDLLPKMLTKKIIILWEPPTLIPEMYHKTLLKKFDCILTWDTSKKQTNQVFHFLPPVLRPIEKTLVPFSQRRLLTQICTARTCSSPEELCSLQRSVIDYFEAHPEMDFTFYGAGWKRGLYRKHGGRFTDKIATLQQYRFSVCIENARNPGYITEKIFDSFAAGCIPIYYGAPDIDRFIPKNCYIAWEDFRSSEKLYRYLSTMNEKKYLKYLSNIKKFLVSKKAKKFSAEAFAKSVMKVL